MEKLNTTYTEIERSIDLELLSLLKADLLNFKKKQEEELDNVNLKAA